MKLLLTTTFCLLCSRLAWPQSEQAQSPLPSIARIESLVQNGKYQDALKNLDAVEHETRDSADLQRLRGMIAYKQGRLTEAEAAFAKAAELNPKDTEAMQMQGVTLYRMGKPADAIPLLERAHTDVHSVNVDSSYVLATCYLQMQRYDEARRAYAIEYGFPPDSAEAYLLLARFLLRHEDVNAGLVAIETALQKSPALPLAHEIRGEIQLARGETTAAIADFENERKANPLYPAVYVHLGDAYLRAGDAAQALRCLNRAVLLDPSSTGPFIELGKLYLSEKNASMASMYLERASQMDPNNISLHQLLATAYGRMGRQERAAHEIAIAEQIKTTGKSNDIRPQQ